VPAEGVSPSATAMTTLRRLVPNQQNPVLKGAITTILEGVG
jgi:hypothetical protein